MKKLVRFLLGWVRIRVTGAFPERFLNLCGTEQMSFWSPERPDEGTLLVTIPLTEEKRSKVLAKKAFCETERLQKGGLPFFLWNFRSRYALLAGMAFAFVGAAILSGFIMVVDVTGNSELSDSVILTELERAGFGVGSYGPWVEPRALSNQMLLRLPRLSFCAVNISGIRAEVVVREAPAIPEIEDRRQGADIVASADGIILDVDAVVGETLVKEGQSVLKGEILLSGNERHYSGDGSGQVTAVTEVRAEGKVWAQTRRVLRASVPLTAAVKGESQKEHILWGIHFLKKSVKFGSDSSIPPAGCDKIKTDYPLTLPGGLILPMGLEKTVWTERSLTTVEVERSSAEEFLRSRLEERLTALMGEDGEVLGSKTTFSQQNGLLTAELEAACIEQIGVLSMHNAPQ